jgi:hypothetical protein
LIKNADRKLRSKTSSPLSEAMTPVVAPNPRRVAAGRLNRLKRKGLTPEGRERLRQAALRNRPWRFSTGPRTPEGKARVAKNGKRSQRGPVSVRDLKAQLAGLRGLVEEMRAARALVKTGS